MARFSLTNLMRLLWWGSLRRRSDANISLQESALPGFTNRHGPNRKQSDAINNFSDYVNCSSGAAEMLSCSGHIVDWMCQGERGTEHARQTKLLNPDLQEFRKPVHFLKQIARRNQRHRSGRVCPLTRRSEGRVYSSTPSASDCRRPPLPLLGPH